MIKHAARLSLVSVFSGAASGIAAADGAANYPNRSIRFIVPFVPGGPSDILSRLLGEKLTRTVKEFIALAKAKPGSLNFAATGTNKKEAVMYAKLVKQIGLQPQ